MSSRVARLAVAPAVLLLLAACGTNKTEAGGGNAASCDTSKGNLVVGVVAPLTGSVSAVGLGIQNATALAVDEANSKCAVKGYKLVMVGEDDQATPQVGAHAASKLAADDTVIGVVGTYNSSVAQAVQPILAAKKIPQVSPANTNPSLTVGDNTAAPKRQFDSYFRVCATDNFQGPYAADYLVAKAGKKKIAIVTDGKTYGKGLAEEFTKRATKDGATIVDTEQVGEKDSDFSGVLAKVKRAKPDAIYYGGEYPVAGPLSKQAQDLGLTVALMGGDGIFDKKFVDLGGKEGDLATSVGAPTDQLQSAQDFVKAYTAKAYKDPYAAYGAFAYDAANAIIASTAKTLGDNGTWAASMRGALVKNIGSYTASGATGPVGFDQYGDSTNKVLTVYQVSGGDWKAAQTGTATS
ncbi:branched-chain amino acid ABC transporter substrate-binding protein [Kutzneria sp. NPDC051319]|uniref:branched-chain amino acid ABC transporter substrate-binding protein n=1 Tax=Kutzneria sp. NPDC051319 TaxID=3155047 RepID=UPI0034417755